MNLDTRVAKAPERCSKCGEKHFAGPRYEPNHSTIVNQNRINHGERLRWECVRCQAPIFLPCLGEPLFVPDEHSRPNEVTITLDNAEHISEVATLKAQRHALAKALIKISAGGLYIHEARNIAVQAIRDLDASTLSAGTGTRSAPETKAGGYTCSKCREPINNHVAVYKLNDGTIVCYRCRFNQ
jgi:hypothetical protein